MCRKFLPFTLVLLLAVHLPALPAAELPGFNDFRRVDRTRRLIGQMQTSELLEVNQISSDLLRQTALRFSNQIDIAWGTAELLVPWPQKREWYETALRLSSNSIPIMVRFAAAAARHGEHDLALLWARQAQQKDNDNTVPWLTELWIQAQLKQPQAFGQNTPIWAATFRDYSADASSARVRLLERAGYSAYAARRLGFKPDSDALHIARDLCKPPLSETTKPLLKDSGTYLQQRRQFLLHELVGQTLERTVFLLRPDADTSAEVRLRSSELEQRREELKKLLAEMERDVVDFATEKQMVDYFNDVLGLGEEDAMKRLAAAVRAAP